MTIDRGCASVWLVMSVSVQVHIKDRLALMLTAAAHEVDSLESIDDVIQESLRDQLLSVATPEAMFEHVPGLEVRQYDIGIRDMHA